MSDYEAIAKVNREVMTLAGWERTAGYSWKHKVTGEGADNSSLYHSLDLQHKLIDPYIGLTSERYIQDGQRYVCELETSSADFRVAGSTKANAGLIGRLLLLRGLGVHS